MFGTCPNGGSAINGDCFIPVSAKKTQTVAEQYCIDTFNGHLLSIHSTAEWNLAKSLAP